MGKEQRYVKSQKWGKAVVRLAKTGPWPFDVHEHEAARKREVPLEGKHLRRFERGEDQVQRWDGLEELTVVEFVIFMLVQVRKAKVRSFSDRQIAAVVHVAPGTVKNTWKRVKGKLRGA